MQKIPIQSGTGGKEINMKRTSAKVICGVLTAAMAATGLTACGDSTVVDGTQTALVINDEEINLGKANFMLRYQQATMASYYETMSSMLGQEYSCLSMHCRMRAMRTARPWEKI